MRMNGSVVVRNNEIKVHKEIWGTLQWLVNGSEGTSDTMTLGRVTIHPGMANPHHVHPNCSEILFVAAGTIRHTLPDGGSVTMHASDSIVIHRGVWHHAENIGDEEAVVLVAFDSAWRETIGESE
jgi:quercetin dioxygenase-like cupin family protein